MPPTLQALLLFVHLVGVVIWVGGMVFAHFVLRPTAVERLPAPVRLPFMAAALGRFFRLVAMAVGAILASGLALLLRVGFAQAPLAWHLMFASGLVMAAVFTWIYAVQHPRLRQAVAAADGPAAAATLDRIRRLVVFNLGLGLLTIAVAVSIRAG